jgi:hypothetical protein
MLGFFKSFIGVKADQAVQESIRMLVRWDPKAATEAELRNMERELDKLGVQVAETRAAFERERREAQAAKQLADQRLAAAEKLEQQLSAEADPTRKAGLEKSLGMLVEMMEKTAADVDREVAEAKDAEDFLKMLEDAYQQAGAKLKGARADLEKAQRDMQRAAQPRSRRSARPTPRGKPRGLPAPHPGCR